MVKKNILLSALGLMFYFNLLGQSTSKIYYPRYDEYNRYVYYSDLDGSNEGHFTLSVRPKAIAVDWDSSPHKLYIGLVPASGNGKIIKCDVDGTNQEDVITDIVGINGIELDLDNRKIYWLKNTYDDDAIYKADMDGTDSNIEQIYHTTTVSRDLWGLTINVPDHKLWITERGGTNNSSYIRSMTTSGASVTTIMNPAYNPHDIEYYSGNLYVGTGDGLVRIATTGSGDTTLLVSGADVDGISIDGTNDNIYWVDYITNNVKMCSLDGSGATDVSSAHSVLSRLDTDYNPSALPVELSSFTAELLSSQVHLAWETATEVNNYGFAIERKDLPMNPLPGGELKGWVKIGFVKGHGNSNSPKSYSFIDKNSSSGNLNYRLKQIDFDGKYEYSEEVSVVIESPKVFALGQNYPNPFNPSTTISYQIPVVDALSSVEVHVSMKVYDILGRLVSVLVDEYKQPGNYKVIFNGQQTTGRGQLTSGIYILRVTASSTDGQNKYSKIRKMLMIK